MKNVNRVLSTYSSDLFGVCSALYELGGMTVMHDASGCNSTYTTHDEPRWYQMDSMVYISALSEMEAVLGDDEKFLDDIVRTARDMNPAFIAIGVFISSLTENQLVSAIGSIFVILALLALGLVSSSITNDALRTVVKWISIFDRYYSFNYGLFDINAVVYYVSISVVFLFLTVRVYEKRRWE